MKYLTFLDYTTLEVTGKNIEAKLTEKDRQMQALKERHEHEMNAMRGGGDRHNNSPKKLTTKEQESLGLEAKEKGCYQRTGGGSWWRENINLDRTFM